jgi:ATP-dependent helicase IRC3
LPEVLEPAIINSQSGIRLRQYQEECIQAVLSHLEAGHKRLGISLATGAGKTVVFTRLIDRVRSSRPDACRTLILAHRQELVEQAARHCTLAYPDKTVDIEMGKLHASGTADITVASVQSIISQNRIQKFQPDLFKLVLVDEAHHVVAPGYMTILKHFGLDKTRNDGPALVGVSATFSRFDGLRLGAAIDHIVYHKDYIDMIGEKWLSDVIFTTVESTADISKVKRAASGDFQPGELSKAVNTHHVNEITVRTLLEKARNRKSTLVFCVDVAHIVSLTEAFRDHGVDARYVTGETPKQQRTATLDAFKAGRFPVLLNCGVFTEGTDVPNIDCVLLARPTKSRNLLVQMIGRGMRLHPGKENCHIIDMVASLNTGIVTTPTLFGLDPAELVEEVSASDMKQIQETRALQNEEALIGSSLPQGFLTGAISVTFTDYNSIADLLDDASGERHIRALSQHSWVQVDHEKYVLSIPSGKFLQIQAVEDPTSGKVYSVEEVVAYKGAKAAAKTPYAPPREIARHISFEDAVHAADTFAAVKYPRQFIHKSQSWRSGPATEGQLMFLNRYRLQDDQLSSDAVTKGKAADMITKLQHGAKGRFARIEAQKKKREVQTVKLQREAALRQREHVSVGPIVN